MDFFSFNGLLVLFGILAIGTELIVGVQTGFDLVLVGSCMLVGGLAGSLVGNNIFGLIIAGALAAGYILFGRNYIKTKLSLKTHKTNADWLIGQKGTVTKEISSDHPGQVKIVSEIWRAESSENLAGGETIEVVEVSGVTLKVVKSN